MWYLSPKKIRPGEILDGEGGNTVYGRLTRPADSLANSYLPRGYGY
jgi:predicted homoserine dehydrogenase-like protein